MIKKILSTFATIILSGLLIWWLNIPFLSLNASSPIIITSTPFLKDIVHYLLDTDVRIYTIQSTNIPSNPSHNIKLTKKQRNLINKSTLILNDSPLMANAIKEAKINKSSPTVVNLFNSNRANQLQMEYLTNRKKLDSTIYSIEKVLLNIFKSNQSSISNKTIILINKLIQLDIKVTTALPTKPIGILCDQNFTPLLNNQAIEIITCEDIINHTKSIATLKKKTFRIPPVFVSKLTNSDRLSKAISILKENGIYTTKPHTLLYEVESDRRDNAYLLVETNMNQIINGFNYKN